MRLALRSRRRRQHARMRQLLALLLAAVAVAIPAARADQFEYVQLPDAQAALRRLQIGDVVHLYCAACGETASRRMTVRSSGIARIWDDPRGATVYRSPEGRAYWTVEVNGRAIDLAYVYVRDGRRWRNLAAAVGLQPVEVPIVLPEAVTGRRWLCGDGRDDTEREVFKARRDPCRAGPER